VNVLVACGGTGDASDDGAGPTRPELGAPIDVATDEQWVWVPIEGSVCSDGSPAGVGVNFTAQSRELLIWFQGNGVCYDATSCRLFPLLLVGMGPDPLDHMWWGDKNTGHTGIFDRNDAANPFRKSNFVVFPHCGVDGHTADKESTYPSTPTVQQRGYANVGFALRRIVPTFLDATRIVVAGFSAGGIGAGANYHQGAVAPSRQQQFYYPGIRHGALAIAPLSATPGLVDFLNGQLGEAENWVNVEP
jgi:hypothetical protein